MQRQAPMNTMKACGMNTRRNRYLEAFFVRFDATIPGTDPHRPKANDGNGRISNLLFKDSSRHCGDRKTRWCFVHCSFSTFYRSDDVDCRPNARSAKYLADKYMTNHRSCVTRTLLYRSAAGPKASAILVVIGTSFNA